MSDLKDDKSMTKIIISILSVLLILFPFSGTLQAAYQNLTFPSEDVITSSIIDAVKSHDLAAIEEMFSERKKNNIGQLSAELQNMFNQIEGEITNVNYILGDGSESSKSGMGYVEKGRSWKFEIKTTTNKYFLFAGWKIIDTLEPQNVGLSSLKLMDSEIVTSEGHKQLALIN